MLVLETGLPICRGDGLCSDLTFSDNVLGCPCRGLERGLCEGAGLEGPGFKGIVNYTKIKEGTSYPKQSLRGDNP